MYVHIEKVGNPGDLVRKFKLHRAILYCPLCFPVSCDCPPFTDYSFCRRACTSPTLVSPLTFSLCLSGSHSHFSCTCNFFPASRLSFLGGSSSWIFVVLALTYYNRWSRDFLLSEGLFCNFRATLVLKNLNLRHLAINIYYMGLYRSLLQKITMYIVLQW